VSIIYDILKNHQKQRVEKRSKAVALRNELLEDLRALCKQDSRFVLLSNYRFDFNRGGHINTLFFLDIENEILMFRKGGVWKNTSSDDTEFLIANKDNGLYYITSTIEEFLKYKGITL